MTEYMLYGGKGGVGKTTCAAATGLALAAQGHRTLVVSSDPAHSLGDALETDLSGEPTEVGENLWAVEADPEAGQDAYEGVVKAMAAQFREAGISLSEEDVEQLFDAGFAPGSDELAALSYLDDEDGQWDRIVLDTAPTGHTLRLLALPDVLDEGLSTAKRVMSDVGRMVDSAQSMLMGPAAFLGGDDDEDIVELQERLERVRSVLRDESKTDFRVVLVPEAMALAETRRLVDRLRSFEVPVETLVANRVLESADGDCERCDARAESHRKRLAELDEAFPELERIVVPDAGPEADGRETLQDIGRRLTARPET